ncbi:hypothetical protein [Actinomyces sp.]|uniref:hypothetical protein n=1 Tax=Actinomyces sp. TaxID=29317 RepID=UPI002908DFB0|nr:hypothetical protein [Actinomyces sp.]MDU7239820.1 hypothetical protein [Actinomyces sp.]
MTRPSTDIERVVASAAKALTALQDLAADLETLKDSDNPFIGNEERRTLCRYHAHARKMTLKTDEVWGWLASLYEAAAWIEEEEIAEQCQK